MRANAFIKMEGDKCGFAFGEVRRERVSMKIF
jgi:hypothetical protein